MKDRTNRILLAIFAVSLVAYALLLWTFVEFPWNPGLCYPLWNLLFWLVWSGHAVPFFALQLLLCRRSEGSSKFLAIGLTVVVAILLVCFTLSVYTTPGLDALFWTILALGTIAPAAGCVLAWIVWGAYFLK